MKMNESAPITEANRKLKCLRKGSSLHSLVCGDMVNDNNDLKARLSDRCLRVRVCVLDSSIPLRLRSTYRHSVNIM